MLFPRNEAGPRDVRNEKVISYTDYDDVIARVYEYQQEHVFCYWDELSDDEKRALLDDLAEIDFALLGRLAAQVNESAPEHLEMEPAPYIAVPRNGENASCRQAVEIGSEYIARGTVAAFVVAGGQGSRLGFDGPKGKYPVGAVSRKPLFQIHAEKIAKYGKKYNTAIPWLIMTSPANHDEAVAFLQENDFFGLHRDEVMIFPQEMIPSLDAAGKLILATRSSIFKNPDGHGGSLTALHSSGALDFLKKRGIETISYFQVDNPLVKIVDPAFIGYHVQRDALVSSKAIRKAYPEEKVGVFVSIGDRIGVVEYSDLTDEQKNLRDAAGELRYCMGSIAIHLFDVDFVSSITAGEFSLPYHVARKKIEVCVENETREREGFKFEKFVFDALPLTERNIVVETVREDEFAPVKNRTGVDSVETARSLMSDLFRRWLHTRGIPLPDAVEVIEISPLCAVEPEDLDRAISIPERQEVYLSGECRSDE